jgi:ankyrin repeat protein
MSYLQINEDDWTELHEFCWQDQTEKIPEKYFTTNKLDFLKKDKQGNTPLGYLIKNGRFNIIPSELLTHENLTIENVAGWTALHWAGSEGHLKQLPPELLTKENIHLKSKHENRTPLELSISNEDITPDRLPLELITLEQLKALTKNPQIIKAWISTNLKLKSKTK